MSAPCLVIAGTQSGVGKTSITLGLVAALTRRGLRVQTFKVGPDFLDPTYLALASGRPCLNLDGWMSDREYVMDCFAQASADADVAIVEGVMGMFDGADPAGLAGSTAEIAQWLGAPVLLVANAHGAGRSFAAMVHGFATFLPEIQVAGVIANRCGSARHAEVLGISLESAGLPRLSGAVARGGLPELPSRHLGLVTADGRLLTSDLLGKLADAVEASVDLDGVLELAKRAQSAAAAPATGEMPPTIARLGVARDEAFHFYYPDNLAALERAGCEIVQFSPLHDSGLPDGLDGIYLGGGYPEEFAAQLSSNTDMLGSIRAFAAAGRPIYAECGGLMFLSAGIETLDGTRHPMLGLLPAWTRMCAARKSLGYMEVTTTRDCPWGPPGTVLRGHEFHYSELIETPACETGYEIRSRRGTPPRAEGYLTGSIFASYVHLHFASRPECVRHFTHHLLKSCKP
ncbi:MAG: cobyrinate a,c-diamide synthase [Verrucomicrobiales bacterium]|nr:cobyrinate a,c-diamide synthase [Verrucomicrobiota bacterium JB025]